MEDNLVSRRSKRSTAGNRMEAALAEMSIDDLMQDAEEDVDFYVTSELVEEEDLFESDFAETDEEMDDDDAGEKALEDEERRARRAARAKVFKAPRAPARKVTFGPSVDGEHAETPSSVVKVRSQRRVSLGQAIDAATGEILESSKRQSTREATRMNTQELRSRLKDAYSRKAVVPKRPKEVERRRTQADLIAAALDTEEENIKSHREYLVVEEERRKKARVVKPTTVGPKLRWRSRMENVTITVYEPAPIPQPVYQSRPTWATTSATPYNGYYPYSYYTPQAGATPQPPYQPFSPYYAYPPPVGPYASQPRPHLQLQPPQQVARKKTEKQAKNYAEILLNEDPKSKPEWREVMDVLFGRHADWDNVRVYYGKNRPVSRQIHTCPITGLQARYRDPRSGVPYANAGAFRILTRLLVHEYVWSPDGANSGVFVGHEKQRGALGVPESWGEAMGGVGGGWRSNAIEERTAEKEKEKEKKEEKQKEKTRQKDKEKRVGGRRSSRIAGDGGNSTVKPPDSDAMDVDKPDEAGQYQSDRK
ncbi:YL1 nuclear protein-domain-containing protein [Hysterangium stoloniferum]|nr:YL1 nuclear protein-domain-containing protein [Hysterangium stoloniferum]